MSDNRGPILVLVLVIASAAFIAHTARGFRKPLRAVSIATEAAKTPVVRAVLPGVVSSKLRSVVGTKAKASQPAAVARRTPARPLYDSRYGASSESEVRKALSALQK